MQISLIFPFVSSLLQLIFRFSSFGSSQSYIVDNLKNVIKFRSKSQEQKSSDILQALLDKSEINKADKSGATLTKEEVVANAFVVFAAGFETTATSLAFTFYLLVKHPEVQQRLYEEIQKAEDTSYATIQGLQYLDQVFNEALRLYPPVTLFTSRSCSQDYQTGSYTFPKGCEIIAPVWDMHHDPDLWPDPYKFDPDRFSLSNKGSINSVAYIPFGVGPRNCVGARFAQLEAKTIIFKLLRKVKLETCEKTEDPLDLICHTLLTQPANGVWVKATKRND